MFKLNRTKAKLEVDPLDFSSIYKDKLGQELKAQKEADTEAKKELVKRLLFKYVHGEKKLKATAKHIGDTYYGIEGEQPDAVVARWVYSNGGTFRRVTLDVTPSELIDKIVQDNLGE